MQREAYLPLSQEDVYELVWSKPMVELAPDFDHTRVLGPSLPPAKNYFDEIA